MKRRKRFFIIFGGSMIDIQTENDTVIEVSVSKRLVKTLDFHCNRLQCIVPNTINFFNEDFMAQIQFVLAEAGNIQRKGVFAVSDSVAEKLLKDVVELRGSVLACSTCIRMTFYESFDFVFNVLIRMLNKRKFVTDNFFMFDSVEVELEENYLQNVENNS